MVPVLTSAASGGVSGNFTDETTSKVFRKYACLPLTLFFLSPPKFLCLCSVASLPSDQTCGLSRISGNKLQFG